MTIRHQGFAKKIICNAQITSIDSGKSIKVTAMWDTGATRSLINDNIVKKLQLKAINLAIIKHVAGTETYPVYSAALKIVPFPNIHTFDMIIGMDIITLGKFCIENKNSNSFFSFKC
ncbi:MAG: hypothetical protein LBC75_06595 [Fibromonadaceae bacterium]|nr:hypothetical protein [Fibromonadaceae bacterium]